MKINKEFLLPVVSLAVVVGLEGKFCNKMDFIQDIVIHSSRWKLWKHLMEDGFNYSISETHGVGENSRGIGLTKVRNGILLIVSFDAKSYFINFGITNHDLG